MIIRRVGITRGGFTIGGASRRTVIAACEATLRRLGATPSTCTSSIDVHPDRIDETLRALDDLVSAGKIRYIGSSGATGRQLVNMCGALTRDCAHHLIERGRGMGAQATGRSEST